MCWKKASDLGPIWLNMFFSSRLQKSATKIVPTLLLFTALPQCSFPIVFIYIMKAGIFSIFLNRYAKDWWSHEIPSLFLSFSYITLGGGMALPDFPGLFKSPVSKWRIVGVKTRTKAFFFEEILINIPSENLSKLSKERMQYFCHALKQNWRSRHSASARAIVRWTGRSNQTWL